MLSALLVAALSTAVAAQTTQSSAFPTATPVTDNPTQYAYRATLPDRPFFSQAAIEGNVRGSILGRAPCDGSGINLRVDFQNLPLEGGPFMYHIHARPVPSNGNCSGTLGHLDPTRRRATPRCYAPNRASCEVGDLSGKYGDADPGSFQTEYHDPFLSTKEDNPAFFGNLSFVIHYANGTRLTCGNFTRIENPDASSCPNTTRVSTTSTSASSSSTSSSSTSSSSSSSRTASASPAASTEATRGDAPAVKGISSALLLVAGAALVFVL